MTTELKTHSIDANGALVIHDTNVRTIDLSGTQVTDLSALAGMTWLTTLDLTGTQVTDLTPLAGLTGLRKLDLSETNVTDMSPLAGLIAAGLRAAGHRCA